MPRSCPLVAVVNDEVAFVRVLNALLHDHGYDTLLLQVGEVAYESLKQERPDLIILDISSAQSDLSWLVLDLLALDPITQTIPLIICTVPDAAYEKRAAQIQALGHVVIEKPFTIDVLATLIRERLQPMQHL